VGLYVVIDAFANLDEFTKRADGAAEIFSVMGRYYLVHQVKFFDDLCGVIGMMAAIFTVTWMQRNNEQIAMLAAGISTQRSIWPVLVMSVVVNILATANQETVIPKYGEELSRRHDDDGSARLTMLPSRKDSNGVLIQGSFGDRATNTIVPTYVTVTRKLFGKTWTITGRQATYIPVDHPTAPLKGGWLIREATIDPPLDEETLRTSGELIHRVDNIEAYPKGYTGNRKNVSPARASNVEVALLPHSEIAYLASLPPFPGAILPLGLPLQAALDRKNDPRAANDLAPTGRGFLPHSEITYLASLPPLPGVFSPLAMKLQMVLDEKSDLGRTAYFLKTSLTFKAMTRGLKWIDYATTPELIRSLTDPGVDWIDRKKIAMRLHVRLLRPLLSLALVGMSLPLVLGGYGRNMFINLGFALGNSAIFYGSLLFTGYLGDFDMISMPMVAWGPMMLFGVIATLRWGQIRT
jgi:hypothetical protein